MSEKSDFRLKSCIKGHIADQDKTIDPYWIMSEVCYEGGQKETSLKHLKQSALKYAFHLPEIRQNADPEKVFKSDYRETLLSYGSFKKDAVDILKQYEHLL